MKRIVLLCLILLLGGLIWDGYDKYKESHTIHFRTTMSLSNATVRTSQVVGSSVNETDRKAER
jgi:hypothetical protein